MKKIFCIQLKLFFIFSTIGIYTAQAQCVNSGIGTNTPTSKLHIVGCGTTSSTSSLQVTDGGSTPRSLFFVRDDGNVGIGTTNPVTQLHITNGAGYGSIFIGDNGTIDGGHHITHEPSDKSLVFWSGYYGSGTQRMKLDVGGNLGINIPFGNPVLFKLHVVGNDPVGRVACFQSANYQTVVVSNATLGAYNPLVKATDNGIFWHDGFTNSNASNGFVIGPWTSTSKGIRIDGPTGFLGVGTNSPEDMLQVGSLTSKAIIGSAVGANLGYGTSYLGFNASRQGASTWSTGTDAWNNGASLIYGDITGAVRFVTIPSVPGTPGSTNPQSGITDATIATNTRLFIHSNGNVGVKTITPSADFEINGWQCIRNVANPLLMLSSYNVNSTKSMGMDFNGGGATPTHEFRLARFNKSNTLWEANVFVINMMAPNGSFLLNDQGNVGIGTIAPVANARLAIKDGHVQIQQTTAPAIAIGAAATAASLSNATDAAGKISITTNTTAGVGATITFNKVYAVAPVVIITPTNANAAAQMVSAQVNITSTTTAFVVNFGAAPTATVKTFNYVV